MQGQPAAERQDQPEESDEALMLRIADGDRSAYDQLVRRHLQRVYAVARGMVYRQQDAEDVAQDVFIRIWIYAKRWEPGHAAVTTWLHRIVMNCCFDHLRKQSRQPLGGYDADILPDDAKDMEGQMAAAQQKEKIRRALQDLPERQRMAVTLCYLQEMTNAEAAKVMDVHIKALEGLLVRARKALRPVLEGI